MRRIVEQAAWVCGQGGDKLAGRRRAAGLHSVAVLKVQPNHQRRTVPRLTFIAFDGRRYPVDVPEGSTLMRAAIDHGVPGIDGDCGGLCACATCHVFVEPPWDALAGGRTSVEEDMLNFTAELRGSSRLACQIRITEALDGLEVTMPNGQH
jgi:2Fe-2S ferredoxin